MLATSTPNECAHLSLPESDRKRNRAFAARAIAMNRRRTPEEQAENQQPRALRGLQRQRLIDACISALHIHGPSKTTVEKVVAIAQMSPGIVRFYFDSKDALLVASLEFLATEFEDNVLLPITARCEQPVEALKALVELYLSADIASTRKVSVWYSFWGEASSRQEYLEICGARDAKFERLVNDLIGRVIATERITTFNTCLLYTSPSPRDGLLSRMPSSA